MSEQVVPFTIYAESTPNPATMKFVANKYLIPGLDIFEYTDPNNAEDSPLATNLFRFSFVKEVFIAKNFVTITKTDIIEWEDVVHQTREFIRDFLNNGGKVVNDDAKTPENEVTNPDAIAKNTHSEPQNDVEKNIIAILDEYIKPAVENDGGAIVFDSYDEGQVNLILKGACSGCPSSTMTLKAGIEGLLKKMMPEDVKEVSAVNG